MPWFPLYVDLKGNNCTIFGGGSSAAAYAAALLEFQAMVTVVSPCLCDELGEMDKKGLIRFIPRKYFRGDCASSYICIAATGNDTVNIAISDECKARAILVCVHSPKIYGTFQFPAAIACGSVTLSGICGDADGDGEGEVPEEKLRAVLRTAADSISGIGI